MDGITETTTIFHRIAQEEPHRNERHDAHKEQNQSRDLPPLNGEEQENAQRELYGRDTNRGCQRDPIGQNAG